ncbi:MAG: UDP-N-acetylmuramoyl-L-alanine--D-glutamate ligase [Patescibacteria group bacterium]
MKVAILGFSREGVSALRFLKKQKLVFGRPKREVEYWILDAKTNTKIPRGVRSKTGKNYLSDLSIFDYIFRSPGVPYMKKELVSARRKGIPFSSLTKIFFGLSPCPIIGITGTRGKGTVATMLYRILKAEKRDVHLLGNIGTPALNLLPRLTKNSLVIYELSSFQLQDMTVSPHISILLHISPDHLDAHKNFREYIAAKGQITAHQKKDDLVFYVEGDAATARLAAKGSGKKIKVSLKNFSLFKPSLLYLPAPHLFENAAMAATVALHLGAKPETVRKSLGSFPGNEFRLQPLGQKKGVRYFNDSSANNPLGTTAALQSFHDPIVLITGGKDKGINYKPLAQAINRADIRAVILIGEVKKKLKRWITKPYVVNARSLEEAVSLAQKKAQKNDVILFSPGTSSFDMFKDYEDRGRQFTKIVRSLPS